MIFPGVEFNPQRRIGMLRATLWLTGILVVLTAVPVFSQDANPRGDVRFRVTHASLRTMS